MATTARDSFFDLSLLLFDYYYSSHNIYLFDFLVTLIIKHWAFGCIIRLFIIRRMNIYNDDMKNKQKRRREFSVHRLKQARPDVPWCSRNIQHHTGQYEV